MKIAKVDSSEDFYYNRFDEASSSLLDIEYGMQRLVVAPADTANGRVSCSCRCGLFCIFKTGTIPIASFVILILLFSRIFPQFIALNTDVSMIVSNVASVKMVMKLDEELADPAMRVMTPQGKIVFKKEIKTGKR